MPAAYRRPYSSGFRDEEWLLVVSHLILMTKAAPQRDFAT